jgi:hypothetical protein
MREYLAHLTSYTGVPEVTSSARIMVFRRVVAQLVEN